MVRDRMVGRLWRTPRPSRVGHIPESLGQELPRQRGLGEYDISAGSSDEE